MSSRGSHVATPLLIEGFAAAIERLRAVGLSEAAGFHALFEALAWAGTIRGRLNPGQPASIEGLWYVRNLALHEGADVVWRITAYGAGAFGSGPFGGVGFGGATSHVFSPRTELPAHKRGSRRTPGSEKYDRFIAGEDVLAALDRGLADVTGPQIGPRTAETAS